MEEGPDFTNLAMFIGLDVSHLPVIFADWQRKDESIKRMAFFGDSCLQWLMVNQLRQRFPTLPVEQLQKMMERCTSNETMDHFLKEFGIVATRRGDAKFHHAGTLFEALLWRKFETDPMHIADVGSKWFDWVASNVKETPAGVGSFDSMCTIKIVESSRGVAVAMVKRASDDDVEIPLDELPAFVDKQMKKVSERPRLEELDKLSTCNWQGCNQRLCFLFQCSERLVTQRAPIN